MIYLKLYLAAGVVTLCAVWLQNWAQKRREVRPRFLDTLAELQGKKSLAMRILEDVVVPALAGLLVVAVWPFALVMLVKSELAYRKQAAEIEAKKFAITAGDLVEKVSVEEIEARERIEDPLGAVPDLPFGHLNNSWVAWRDALDAGAELWSFDAGWSDYRGAQRITGYVAVRGKKIGPHFVVLTRLVDDD